MSAKSNSFFNFLTEGLDGQTVVLSPQNQIDGVHYSWVAERLQQEPKPLQALFLASLPEATARSLAEWLPPPDLPLSEPIQSFLLIGLIRRLFPHSVIPIACLSLSPLKPLVDLPKEKLVRLVGLLGLHDLALELRQTLDKEAILTIQQLLTPMQKEVLDSCMRGQDILPASSYGLAKWGAGRRELAYIAQKQGLMRLGKALANDERSLLWHIAHKLDTGRGKLVINYGRQEVSPTISKRLTGQIVDLMELIG